MSMSTYVIGLTDPTNETYLRMKAVVDACNAAGVDYPEGVEAWYKARNVHPSDGTEEVLYVEIPKKQWNSESGSAAGYEIDTADIPPDVKIIRFYNSW